jgi:hypothetical protein
MAGKSARAERALTTKDTKVHSGNPPLLAHRARGNRAPGGLFKSRYAVGILRLRGTPRCARHPTPLRMTIRLDLFLRHLYVV